MFDKQTKPPRDRCNRGGPRAKRPPRPTCRALFFDLDICGAGTRVTKRSKPPNMRASRRLTVPGTFRVTHLRVRPPRACRSVAWDGARRPPHRISALHVRPPVSRTPENGGPRGTVCERERLSEARAWSRHHSGRTDAAPGHRPRWRRSASGPGCGRYRRR